MAEKVNPTNNSVWYWCPGCQSNHRITFRGEHSWTWNGDLEKPTFNPSILVNAGQECPSVPRCHHFVRDGKIEYLSDCTHQLAGKTVEMEDF